MSQLLVSEWLVVIGEATYADAIILKKSVKSVTRLLIALRLKGFFRLFDSTNPWMDVVRTTQEQLSSNPWMDVVRTTQEQLSCITHTVRANVRLIFKKGR